MTGASAPQTGLGSSREPEPSGLGPSGAIPRAAFTPGPWELCAHLAFPHVDKQCACGYRGVIFGPDDDKAICQPGHEPAPKGQEGSEPGRYPREVEIANARLIASAPELYEALEACNASMGDGRFNRLLAKARGEQ